MAYACDPHECNPRCEGNIHYDVVYEAVGYNYTEEDIRTIAKKHWVDIITIKPIAEYEEEEYEDINRAFGITFTWI